MEQLVIVLVIAAIAFVKWLMEKSAEQRARRETEERMDRLERGESPASPIQAPRPTAYPMPDPDFAARKLREALGIPDEHELPPARRRPVITPPTFQVEEITVVPVTDLEQRVVAPVPPPVPKWTPAPVLPPREPVPTASAGLDDLLRSRDGLRRAILVQEILGTPKGLVF